MTKLTPPPANPNALNTTSAGLSNATHLNLQMARGKLDLTKPDKPGTSPVATTKTDGLAGALGDTSQDPALGSALDKAGKDFFAGAGKGVLSTLKGAGTLGSKILSGIASVFGAKDIVSSDIYKPGTEASVAADKALEASNPDQAFAKGAEQIGEFLIPGGDIGKFEEILAGGAKTATVKALVDAGATPKMAEALSKAASLGTKMAVRAGEGGAIIGTQTGGKDAGKAAGANAVFSGIGSGVLSPVLSKVLAPFKDQYESGLAKMFESEGIKAPVSALNSNGGVRNLEAVASKTLFGKEIAKTAQEAIDQLETKTNQTIESMTPKKSMSDQDLGKMLQTGLHEFETNFKQTEDRVYEDFSRKYGNAPTRPLDTKSELSSILAQQGEDLFKGVSKPLKSLFEKISDETPEIRQAVENMKNEGLSDDAIQQAKEKLMGDRPPFEMTFNQMKSTRSSVGEELAKDPQNAALKRLYGALSRDMQETVNYDPAGKEQLAKLNASYKAGKDKIESRIAQSMVQSNPEKIAHNLLQRNSADAINSLKEIVGPERFKEVSKYFVSDLMDAGKTEGGKFKLDKLKSALSSYDQQTLDAILSPKEQTGLKAGIDHLENLQTMTDATKAGGKAATGSQTAFLVNSAASASALATGITTALMSGNFTILGALAGKTGLEYGLAKFIASDLGRKILTEGITPESLKALDSIEPALRAVIVENVKSKEEK